MSDQSSYGQGAWQQQPPSGPPPPGGPSPIGHRRPPRRSKVPLILGIVGVVVVLAGVSALVTLTVFSGDDEAGGYCGMFEDNKDDLESLFTTGNVPFLSLDDVMGPIHELRVAAPAEVADEWAVLDDRMQDVQSALDKTGTTWEDLRTDGFHIPISVSEALDKLQSPGLDFTIPRTIAHHADEQCGLEFNPYGWPRTP